MKIIADLFQMERPCLKAYLKNDVLIALSMLQLENTTDVPVGVGAGLGAG